MTAIKLTCVFPDCTPVFYWPKSAQCATCNKNVQGFLLDLHWRKVQENVVRKKTYFRTSI